MTAKGTGGKAAGKKARRRVVADAGCAVVVSAEQQRCLIEDAAYFRAERYRGVAPGQYREEDRRRAAADIKSVLKRHRKG